MTPDDTNTPPAIHLITPDNPPQFPCWLWDEFQNAWHWYPDKEGAEGLRSGFWCHSENYPTVTPDATLPPEVREAIAAELYAAPYQSLGMSGMLNVKLLCEALAPLWPRPAPVMADAAALWDRAFDAYCNGTGDPTSHERAAAVLAPVVARAEKAEAEANKWAGMCGKLTSEANDLEEERDDLRAKLVRLERNLYTGDDEEKQTLRAELAAAKQEVGRLHADLIRRYDDTDAQLAAAQADKFNLMNDLISRVPEDSLFHAQLRAAIDAARPRPAPVAVALADARKLAEEFNKTPVTADARELATRSYRIAKPACWRDGVLTPMDMSCIDDIAAVLAPVVAILSDPVALRTHVLRNLPGYALESAEFIGRLRAMAERTEAAEAKLAEAVRERDHHQTREQAWMHRAVAGEQEATKLRAEVERLRETERHYCGSVKARDDEILSLRAQLAAAQADAERPLASMEAVYESWAKNGNDYSHPHREDWEFFAYELRAAIDAARQQEARHD